MKYWIFSSYNADHVHSGKRIVTVWRPFVYHLFCRHAHHDSPGGGNMRRGQYTFLLDNKEDQHTSTFYLVLSYMFELNKWRNGDVCKCRRVVCLLLACLHIV